MTNILNVKLQVIQTRLLKYWKRYLIYDERGYVRIGVALNPNTPINILERLAKDEDSIVKNFAHKRIEKNEIMK